MISIEKSPNLQLNVPKNCIVPFKKTKKKPRKQDHTETCRWNLLYSFLLFLLFISKPQTTQRQTEYNKIY